MGESAVDAIHIHIRSAVFGNCAPIPYDVTLVQGGGRAREERYWIYLARRP